jgi:hypothetical protein
MMRGRVAPSIMPTLVHASRQNAKVPQMSSPQERQTKEHRQKVKKEHDTMFPKVEEHL